MKAERTNHQPMLALSSIRTVAALCSLGSAGVHVALAPEHFREWWGYGWFFLAVAVIQVLYSVGLVAPRARLSAAPSYLITGVAFNLWVVGLYAMSRIDGVPLFGPHAGHVEAASALGMVSKTLEAGTVASLSALLFGRLESRDALITRLRWAGLALLAILATLALLWVLGSVRDNGAATQLDGRAVIRQQGNVRPLAAVPESPALPTFTELVQLLVRGGVGPRQTSADVLYAPPVFFRVLDEEPPVSSLTRPTLVFRLAEADHEHYLGLAPEPPQVRLRLDGGPSVAPYQVTILKDGDEHRTTELLFPMPEGVSQQSLDREDHTLTFAILLEDGQESTFNWLLPLPLPLPASAAGAAASEASVGAAVTEAPPVRMSDLTKVLGRSAEGVQYGGSVVQVEAIYASPEYLAAAFSPDVAARFRPDRHPVILLTEKLHTADLPSARPDTVLNLDGRRFTPDMVEDVASSAHHRVTLMRFPAEAPTGIRHHVMELSLPDGASMEWHFPISYGAAGVTPAEAGSSAGGLQVTWVWLLAILGGLVAAMWPCLFQLTVFFIPALAGMSMHDASSSVSLVRRASVVKAALFFVLGFTVVYTVAGGVIGYLAGRLSDMSAFYQWQRYLGIGGGVVILILALRVAAQVRAPLVCKMPVLSGMGKRKGPASPLQMMFAGVAFATGCMTCFGAAVVVAMVVYVGLSGSAFIGAFTLFLFALGMGIPLVMASTAMARVLPLLGRFEKAVRWMGLASTLVMVGFAVLLITGNYMALTEWVYRVMPALGSG